MWRTELCGGRSRSSGKTSHFDQRPPHNQLEPLEEREQLVAGLIRCDWRCDDAGLLECLALHLNVGLDVLVRRVEIDVPEPRPNHVELDSGLEQLHPRRVA